MRGPMLKLSNQSRCPHLCAGERRIVSFCIVFIGAPREKDRSEVQNFSSPYLGPCHSQIGRGLCLTCM